MADTPRILERKEKGMMTMVPPTNGYARDLEQGKAGSVVPYHGTSNAGTGDGGSGVADVNSLRQGNLATAAAKFWAVVLPCNVNGQISASCDPTVHFHLG
ncbi:hypothetical protein ASPBRDRAFT_169223 [Aspergillus brasiliensis CBS 101740]|uniref:Uncharacterized protein n=1 Tax=Aspergillus brasiliensis (strain CBS 101740 / IMI 381727 / IBT 21946) TaxID=767769 RepID=A0A1L9UW83_ASPBC|nr:hypothetical protein ASPBRDRAFT_169223 [Aspergillus brasiliensis CBS 101740]